MTTRQGPVTVDASPTKSLFVEMLTKDVRMQMAILDLVDNSIDGAIRIRGQSPLTELTVRITFDQEHFIIQDNCGGIPLNLATDYAFRFGRPANAPSVNRSVGRFGVGMKRALFKLGRFFDVATTNKDERYRIAADVDKWLDLEEWTFPVLDLENFDEAPDENDVGTTITATRLTEEAKRWVSIPYNLTNLTREISKRHQYHIDNGITISLNGITIPTSDLEFLVSESPLLRPAYKEFERDGVHVRVVAGVGHSSPREAGWYVYCNGRMILDADRTRTTGWGEPGMMPRFHNQYSRFRGATYFDSDDSTLLPWTTTKDGVDEGVPIFSEAYTSMLSVMSQVIRFLDAVDRDNERPEGSRPLMELVERTARAVPILGLSRSENFRFQEPPPPVPASERIINIQYQKPAWLVDAVRKSLNAPSARSAGEMTFDYYVDQENINAR